MKRTNKMLQTWLSVTAFAFISFMQTTALNASELEFQENASEVMINSLQAQPKHSFLKKLYRQLLFVPVWMREKFLSPAAKEFFAYIKDEGTLNRNGDMFQSALLLEKKANDLYANSATLAEKINLEFKISQLYKGYTDYAYFGSINWGAFQARIANLKVNDVSTEWVLHRPVADPIGMVENALLGESLKTQLHTAVPSAYRYKALQKELHKYMQIQTNGGWAPVTLKRKLKAGKSAQGVLSLRERLKVTGDYITCKESSEGSVYDSCLQKAVKHFQERNGLNVDSVVGAGTLRVLNRSVDDRITTIRLNLDRIKWLNKRESKRHIMINIPAFTLYFEDDGKLIQSIRTIVGTPKNPTPIFSNTVKTIVLNPYWNVPKSIIQKEMIPKLLKNSNAMVKKNIEIYTGWGKDAKKINASSVDWKQYQYSKTVPFRFAQVPGTKNALGKVKFLFPNKYAVYMHDTPTKSLFKKEKRAFSHGCIRLQKPRELLKTFSKFNSNVNFAKSQKILKGKKRTYMALKDRVPVDVVYLTAWVDSEEKLQFRNDIYGYDKMQLKSFRKW